MNKRIFKSNTCAMENTPTCIEGISDGIMGVPMMSSVGKIPLDTKEAVYLALRALLDFLY